MFYLNMMIQLNVSVSDFIMILMLYWVISNKENRELIARVLGNYKHIIIYLLLLIYVCILSMTNYFLNIFVDITYGISAILKLSVNFSYILVFLIYLEKYKRELLIFILRWWRITAMIISLLCIGSVILYQFGIDNGMTLGGRAQATLNDPNLAALYLVISFSFIMLYSNYVEKKFMINLSTVLILIALFLTASRGGIISILLAVVIVLFLTFMLGRMRELLIFIAIMSLFLIAFLWVNETSEVLRFAIDRVTSVGSEGDGTSYRVFLWMSAFDMWTNNPLIGIGIGQFIAYSTEMYGVTFMNIPHNTYLTFLTETGMVGFLAFLWFPLYLFFRLVVFITTNGEKKYYVILIGLIAVGIQAISINIENIRFVWIYLTIAFVLSYHTKEKLWR